MNSNAIQSRIRDIDAENENPPGTLRQTELGDVPKDWGLDRLSRFWQVVDCKHITADFVSSGIPVVSIREVQSRFVDLKEAKQTTEAVYIQLIEGGRKPSPGDLILSRNATVGEVAQVADYHLPFAMGQDVCLLRRKSPNYSPGFLQSVLKSGIVSHQLENLMVGSTFRRVNVQQIKALIVPMPPPPEQQAIAEALSDVDGLLMSLDALIAKKRAIKQATMQQLLTGKTRLPGFSAAWDGVKLGEIFDFKNGLNKAKEFFGHGTPIVNYMDVFAKAALISSELTGRVRLSMQEIQNFDVRRGDVFFTRTSETTDEIGIAAVMMDEPTDTVFSGFVLRARPKNQLICDEFKAYCFACRSVRNQIVSTASYTTRALTNGKLLSRVSLILPPRAEQAAIATVLADMDAEIAALERRRDKTRAIKQGMMQQLLTGRIRLVEPPQAESRA